MTQKEAHVLIQKYIDGQCTETERAKIETWYLQYEEGDIASLSREQLREMALSLPEPQIIRLNRNSRFRSPVYWWAAVLIVAGCCTAYFMLGQKDFSAWDNDVLPGGNRATLILADGQQIQLDSAKEAIQVGDGDTHYMDGTRVRTEKSSIPTSPATSHLPPMAYNSLQTPKGGQYQVILEDGTKVWLNAASTLRYPSHFSRSSREVELDGEGYFEVSGNTDKQRSKPFIVKSRGQEIRVLGTAFNVSAYADDVPVRTTLVNGAVQVSNVVAGQVRLQPQEQSLLFNSVFSKHKADLESELAWKNGYFKFTDHQLSIIMLQLERWYDIEVSYKDVKVAAERFSGRISRFRKISQVLKMLEATGAVHFSIQGRRVVVEP